MHKAYAFLLSPFSFRLHERVSVWVSVNTYALWNYGLTTLMNEFACLARAEKKHIKTKTISRIHYANVLKFHRKIHLADTRIFWAIVSVDLCARLFRIGENTIHWMKCAGRQYARFVIVYACECVSEWAHNQCIGYIAVVYNVRCLSYSFGRCLCCCDILHISHSDVCKQTFKLQLAALSLSPCRSSCSISKQKFQHFLISTSDKNNLRFWFNWIARCARLNNTLRIRIFDSI